MQPKPTEAKFASSGQCGRRSSARRFEGATQGSGTLSWMPAKQPGNPYNWGKPHHYAFVQKWIFTWGQSPKTQGFIMVHPYHHFIALLVVRSHPIYPCLIEWDDGNINSKPLYLIIETIVSG